MASSTTKKAVIERFERETLTGYVNPVSYQQPGGVELLSADGQIVGVPYSEIRWVSFVRDFDAPTEEPRKVFLTRPKMEGLWVRFTLRDGDVLEGVMPNNLLSVESHGFAVIPPDPYSNSQRLFIPRIAVRTAEVLGVVGSPLKRRRAKAAPKEQISLFEE